MDTVKFNMNDGALLYCIPESGCDLSVLVSGYTFFERISIPTYETVAGCIDKAVQSGILPIPIDGKYQLHVDWHSRIHAYDQTIKPSELSMLEFSEELANQEFPQVQAGFVISESEYKKASSRAQERLENLFAHR